MSRIAETLLMSDSTSLVLKSIGVMLAGLLVSSGRLDASQANAFANNVQIIGGIILAGLGGFYLLEHAFQSAIAELKWRYSPDAETTPPTPTTVTTNTTLDSPAQPTS